MQNTLYAQVVFFEKNRIASCILFLFRVSLSQVARVVESVDTTDLKSVAFGRASSSLAAGTPSSYSSQMFEKYNDNYSKQCLRIRLSKSHVAMNMTR